MRLLAEKLTVTIMRELVHGPLRPSERGQRLPEAAHSILMRRLAQLVSTGAVRHERLVGLPPRAYYSLADAGRALLGITEESARWEQLWSSRASESVPGIHALRLLADERAIAIMQALTSGPLRPVELERRLSGFGRSAIRDRLVQLRCEGVLARSEEKGRVRYELTAAAHHLWDIATLAANWERHWTKLETDTIVGTTGAARSGTGTQGAPLRPR